MNYQTFYIRCYHNGEKGFGTFSNKRRNMRDDVRTALMADIERGGYASNTEIMGMENDEGMVPPYIILQMSVRCTYLSLDLKR